jgi:4-amino-4-deoxy-L-arabinose transferase-like glycosyltransferase
MPRIKPLHLLLLAFAGFYLLPLGLHGLWTPDETRYAQVSQQRPCLHSHLAEPLLRAPLEV